MKLLPLRYLTVFILLLYPLGISKGQFIKTDKESGNITLRQCFENILQEKNALNLEWRESESRPVNHGEKVETIVIICPVSNHSEIRLINLFTLQKTIGSIKNTSIISHHYSFVLRALHLSPLVNILRN